MKTLLVGLLNRFKEPSSWAGVAMILANLGIQLPDGVAENASYVLSGLAGLAAILLTEQKA